MPELPVPYQFTGNEELYKLAVKLYLAALINRFIIADNRAIRDLILDDMTALGFFD